MKRKLPKRLRRPGPRAFRPAFFHLSSRRKWPRRRTLAQSGADRVHFHINNASLKVYIIPNVAVEIVRRPKLAFAPERPIDRGGGKSFPASDDGAEFVPLHRLKHDVDVIGHHAPCMEVVTIAVKMTQSIRDNASRDGLAEQHRAVAGIQKRLDSPPLLRSIEECKRLNDIPGKAVRQSKHDMLHQAIVIEVRVIAAMMPAAHARTMHTLTRAATEMRA